MPGPRPGSCSARRLAVLGAVLAIFAGTTGCTVAGRAQAPAAQVKAYAEQQQVARQRANATSSCAVVLDGMGATVAAYNAMIGELNATGARAAAGRTVIGRLDRDAAALRDARAAELPAAVDKQMAETARAVVAMRAAVAGPDPASLNPAARDWDRARQRLVGACREYLSR